MTAIWFNVNSLIDPTKTGGRITYGQEDKEQGMGKLEDNGWKNVVTMLALQGIVNRKGPRLMYDTQFWNWKPADLTWRDYYAERKGIVFDPLDSHIEVIRRFSEELNGSVVYDPDIDQSLYVACMIAAQEGLLPVSPILAEELKLADISLEVKHNLVGRWQDEYAPLDWALSELQPKCEPGKAYSVDRLWSGMSIDAIDYAVQHKAFIYRCSTVASFPEAGKRIWKIHQKIGPNCGIYGWGEPEDKYCQMASLNSNYIMCAEAPNLSFHSQVKADTDIWRQKSHVNKSTLKLEDKVYIAFMTTEGDAMKIHTVFQGGAWKDPNRGKAPINWGFQPRMTDIAPAMMEYYFETMSEQDYFFCGCSGAGYTYPNWMQEPGPFFEETEEYLQKSDLSVMDCWIYFSRPVYDEYARVCPSIEAFVMPCGPVGVKMTQSGTPVILRHSALHYYPSQKSAEELAESIMQAGESLSGAPAFLTVFAVPDINENESSQGGFSPTDYLKVMQSLDDTRYKVVTLEEMAWAAKEYARIYPERINKPMSNAAQKRIGVNIVED